MWSGNAKVVVPAGVSITESNGEILFMDEHDERVFGVDGPAAEMLLILQQGKTFGHALTELAQVYDVDVDVLERDLSSILDGLVSRKLLQAASPE